MEAELDAFASFKLSLWPLRGRICSLFKSPNRPADNLPAAPPSLTAWNAPCKPSTRNAMCIERDGLPGGDLGSGMPDLAFSARANCAGGVWAGCKRNLTDGKRWAILAGSFNAGRPTFHPFPPSWQPLKPNASNAACGSPKTVDDGML